MSYSGTHLQKLLFELFQKLLLYKKLTRITRIQETTGHTNTTYHEHGTRGASKGDTVSRLGVHFQAQEEKEKIKTDKAQKKQDKKILQDAGMKAWRDDIIRQVDALEGDPSPPPSDGSVPSAGPPQPQQE